MAGISTFQVSAVYLAILLSGTAFLITLFSLFYLKAYLKRRTGQERILSEMRDEVNSILKLIDETTERDISLIEEREKVLQDLLADIEKRLKTYVREMERQKASEEVAIKNYQDLGKKQLGAQNLAGAYQADHAIEQQTVEKQVSAKQVPAELGSAESGSVSSFPLPDFKVKADTASSRENNNTGAKIRELLQAGLSAPIIASRLGVSISEVEFAEALMERREN